MRKFLLAAAALGALAVAAPAFATSDAYQVQLNLATLQGAQTNISYTNVGGKLTIDTAAVGNNLSVSSTTQSNGAHSSSWGHTNDDARIASVQVNGLTAQTAVTNLGQSSVGGKLEISTQAIGNNVSVSSENGWVTSGYIDPLGDKAINLQVNALAVQSATTNVAGVNVGGNIDLSTVAVASNLTASGGVGAEVFNGQLNLASLQGAATNVSYVNNYGAKAAFNTQAFGNVASIDGNTADVQSIQANLLSVQAGVSNLSNSNFAGNVSVSTAAVGNSLTVKTGL
jgi:hypothetical protein